MNNKKLITQSENLKKEISNSINFWLGLYQTNNSSSANQLKRQLNDKKSTQYKNIYNEIFSDINKVYSMDSIGKAIEGYSSKYEKNFKTFNQKLSEFSSITADKVIGIVGTGLQGSFNSQKITKAIQELMTKRENEFEEYLQKNGGQLENYMILLKGAENGDVDYKYISESTGACDLCDDLNGQSFKMINAKAGINYPPIHPNCKCRVTALKFGSIFGYSHQPKDIVNNLSKLLDNLPYIDKDVERIEQKSDDEDALPTLTHPDYYNEYGPFYEYPWVKTTPPTEAATKEEDYDIEPFMNIPLEERTKWPYQGYEEIFKNKYTIDDIVKTPWDIWGDRCIFNSETTDGINHQLACLYYADSDYMKNDVLKIYTEAGILIDGYVLIGKGGYESTAGKESLNYFGSSIHGGINSVANNHTVLSNGTWRADGVSEKSRNAMLQTMVDAEIAEDIIEAEIIWNTDGFYSQLAKVADHLNNHFGEPENITVNYQTFNDASAWADKVRPK